MDNGKVNAWGAARQAEAQLVQNAASYGMTSKQLDETIGLLYRVAGVDREKTTEKPSMTLSQILSAYKGETLKLQPAQALIDKWYPDSGVSLK